MFKKFYFIFFCFSVLIAKAQQNIINQRGVEFPVRVVIEDHNHQIITEDITILVNGIFYTAPNISGEFIVKGKVDDEIQVQHPDFETVFYTLSSSEDIKIIVDDYVVQQSKKNKYFSKSKTKAIYLTYLDSAKLYKKKDIEKSLSFIEKALEKIKW